MGLTIQTVLRNAMANAITTQIDGGGGVGYIEIWTSAFGTKLGTCNFSATSFGSASTGVITANAIAHDLDADNTGTAAAFKIFDFAASEKLRGLISTSSSDINFAGGTNITQHGDIYISSMTLTVPAS